MFCLGSGKTTFLNRLVFHTQASNIRGYVLNLDPAVMTLPYGANIDIRDTVRYKEVMKQFNLGPNGGILTSLNLFATKFDEVIFSRSFYSNHFQRSGILGLPINQCGFCTRAKFFSDLEQFEGVKIPRFSVFLEYPFR